MCGIAGIYFKDATERRYDEETINCIVDGLLMGIEPRGRHATGYVWATGDEFFSQKDDKDAFSFIEARDPIPQKARMILLHTRYATQGSPAEMANNHPVQYGSVFAVHNGHISNDEEIFTNHRMQRFAEVDSEAIPALFDRHGLDKAHRALQKLGGGFAVGVIDPKRFPDTMVLAKGPGSPLVVMEHEDCWVFASTMSAIDYAWAGTFGQRPAYSRFTHISQPGTILLIEDGAMDKLSFKVKERPRSTSSWSSGTTHSYTGGGYGSISSAESSKLCVGCGCKRFWHAGFKYDGSCMARINGAYCRCSKFKEREVNKANEVTKESLPNETILYMGVESVPHVRCSICELLAKLSDTQKIAGYRICSGCWEPDEKDRRAVTTPDGTRITQKGNNGLSIVQVPKPKEEVEEVEACSVEARVVPPKTDAQSFLERVQKRALRMCAQILGTTEETARMLVFDDEVISSDDPNLISMIAIANDEYTTAEAEAWEIEAEYEKARNNQEVTL